MRENCLYGEDRDDSEITYFIKEWSCPSTREQSFLEKKMGLYIHVETWLVDNTDAIRSTIKLFGFFPIFLMLAALAFLVQRWRRFLLTCHIIQGRVHDIGLLCGTLPNLKYERRKKRKKKKKAVGFSDRGIEYGNNATSKKGVVESAQERLYTIYRYLTVCHILTFKSFSPNLKPLNGNYSLLGEGGLNLLTSREIHVIQLAEVKARDVMMSMLNKAIDDLMQEDYVKCKGNAFIVPKATVLNEKLCAFRGACAGLHDLFVRDNPNEYTVTVSAFIFIYKILVVLMSPLQLWAKESIPLFSLQPGVWSGVFFTFLSFSFPSILFRALKNPFSEKGGIVVDNLIASSELCTFQTLRILWNAGSDDDDDDGDDDDETDDISTNLKESNNFQEMRKSVKMQRLQSSLDSRRGRFRASIPRGEFADM